MNQDEIVDKIYYRVWDKVGDWFTDLSGMDDDEWEKALDTFYTLYNIVGFQDEYNNRMSTPDEINEAYEALKEALTELHFDDDEIEEMMSLIKTLDINHLRKLIKYLEREFYRAMRDIADYLEESKTVACLEDEEECDDEELEEYNE